MSRPPDLLALRLALAALLALAPTARAYDPITWRSIDGGGVIRATGGGYTLGGTIGQPDAGTLVGGGFTLGGGFWFGGQAASGTAEGAPPAFAFRLLQTTPNPVRSVSSVTFELPRPTRVGLTLFDVAGRARQRTEFGLLPAGPQQRTWSALDDGGRPLPSGVYFLRLEAGADRANRKVLVVR